MASKSATQMGTLGNLPAGFFVVVVFFCFSFVCVCFFAKLATHIHIPLFVSKQLYFTFDVPVYSQAGL